MNASPLECFRDTVAHRHPLHTLFYATFVKELENSVRSQLGLGADADLARYFGFYVPETVQPTPSADRKAPDFSGYFAGVRRSPGDFINPLGVLETPSGFHHFTHYTSPLRNASRFEDLEAFPYPTAAGLSETGMKEQVAAAHAQGVPTRTWVGHMYEDAWQIRSYEPFLMDMLETPEWCEYILDRMTERNTFMACAAARAGVDFLMTGDDVANQRDMMFSVEQWRHFMKPRWAGVYAAARAIKPDIQIWYHSDGNIERIIPELIEIGVTILNPVQPECVDPVNIKRRWGKQLTLDGVIGTQTVMPFGTPEDVRRTVKNAIEQLGENGGLILSPTHVLEPEVPLANIVAFAEAAWTYGA
jgi:uroporphyrinogen decarboxylase